MRDFKSVWSKTPKEDQVWRRLLEKKQQLIIEIGAGAGLHAIQYAQAHPKHLIVPIERTLVKATKMLGRVDKHPQLKNIHAVYGDAIQWVCENCFPQEVDAYFILYPNPYPKHKQANKRFINMPFMGKLIETLKPKGKIVIATNIESYFDEIMSVADQWHLHIAENGLLPANHLPRTHFEKKYLARGEDCFQVVLVKE